ncbi:putative 1-acylglycerol-3-phosphate O-acyltransferase [Gracilariopsis chorda]|uniref:Putative 1-acylglycerol-3-phosphate O-acyltransferase n=1 Tax=Gracilariopsis chorda TaxID=448386 RepID=A0A2V3IJH4_9FLOR|nr:putative 1-acylglycerol-3-phosphate O-acyltransferase [Gracilariopsis chorda]|eukprot:PXF42246.1 putative 1-acylglycerol-3-phosphate O-acyltransferase [Gracilariopsis chorda]
MRLFSVALRLFRLAGEAFFFLELNRLFGRFLHGTVHHRKTALRLAESHLLSHVSAPCRTVTISLPSNLAIHTIIVGAAATNPTNIGARPLVLLHGHSMGAASFFRNLDHFIHMGFTSIFAPDLPGWASSSRPLFTGDVQDALAFFLIPFYDWLSHFNLPSFTLAAHSLGAYLAHEYTVLHPKRVSRLILTAPAAITRNTPLQIAMWFNFTPQRFLTRGGLFAHLIFATLYPSTKAYNLPGFRDFTLFSNSLMHSSGDAAAAAMIRITRTGLFSWQSECVRPLLERVSRLHCTVHIITGDDDCLVGVHAVRQLHTAMLAAGNHATIEVIPGADHSPHICAPQLFAKAVMRSLSHFRSSHPYLQPSASVTSPFLFTS